jgi:hypothetical protein
MEVPPADDPAWKDILTGRVRHRLDFFAAKILLGWLLLKVASDPSDDVLVSSAHALQHLFAQNAALPCVQRDLAEIFGVTAPPECEGVTAQPECEKEAPE